VPTKAIKLLKHIRQVSDNNQSPLPFECGKMSEKSARKFLQDYGLTGTEIEVYLFLGKHGVSKGTEIARQIKKDKGQVYNILRNLQTKNLVESTLETPVRFTPVPFENVVELALKIKRDEATSIESIKHELSTFWKNIHNTQQELPPEKFSVIEGRHKVNSKITQMVAKTKNQLSIITTVPGLLRAKQFGLYDLAFNHPLKSRIIFRFLTDISNQNLDAAKPLLEKISLIGGNFRSRTPELGLNVYPKFIIRDSEEILFFITPRNATSSEEQDNLSIWTDCKDFVQAFNGVFNSIWHESTDIQQKITEIEGGKPATRTCVIRDAEIAREKYIEALSSPEEEIIITTSQKGLISLFRNQHLAQGWADKRVQAKIMAPITKENLEYAQELMKQCEVKSIPVGYLETVIVDGKNLFQFKGDLLNADANFENTFYTNDQEYVEKARNLLVGVWQNAQPTSQFIH
jgi:sugar-specific transcriptional regulator TrmB